MKLIKKNVRHFESFDEYSEYYKNHEHREYVTDIVEYEYTVSADAEYECKSWKTAVKRFFNALTADCRFNDWDAEGLIESIENGRWEQSEGCKYGWAYGIEETIEGFWYIYLRVAK